MRTHVQRTVQFGDLVAAVFERAALQSNDSREVSDLATQTVAYMLRHARTTAIRRSPPATR